MSEPTVSYDYLAVCASCGPSQPFENGNCLTCGRDWMDDEGLTGAKSPISVGDHHMSDATQMEVQVASSSLYQSALVRDGTTELFIDGEIKDGTYGPYVPVKLRSGDRKFLNIENDAVRAVLDRAPRERWIKVTATGSRGDAAISVQEDAKVGSTNGTAATPREHGEPDNRPGTVATLPTMYLALEHAQMLLEDRGNDGWAEPEVVVLAAAMAVVAAIKKEGLPAVPK